MPPAIAGDFISGAQLKDIVRSELMLRGLRSRPEISDTRRFRACEAPLQVTPMFGGYKTVSLSCPDIDGFKIAIRTQIGSVDDATETGPNLIVRLDLPNLLCWQKACRRKLLALTMSGLSTAMPTPALAIFVILVMLLAARQNGL